MDTPPKDKKKDVKEKICIFVKVIVKVIDVLLQSSKEYECELDICTSESLNLYQNVRSKLICKGMHEKDALHLWHKDEKIVNEERPCSSYERNSEGKIELDLIAVTKLSISITIKIKFQSKILVKDIPFNLSDTIETLPRYFGLLPEKVVKLKEEDEVLAREKLIVDTPFYKGFIIETEELPRHYKIEKMQKMTSTPSEYGKDPKGRKKMLKEEGIPICDHRGDDIGDDVTLYYPGFQKFIEDSNDTSTVLEREDYEFARQMCTKMSKYFDNEKKRQDEFKKKLSSEFWSVNGSKMYNADISIGTECYVFIEVKNESGQGGGSDSYAQVIAYYVQSLNIKNPYQCPAPGYLLELVGPQLFISGAVFGKYIFVDRLVDPVWLVLHQNEEAMIRIARMLKSLKDAIREIQRYYKAITKRTCMPEFPIFRSFNKGKCKITYQERIKRHVFKGCLEYDDKEPEDVIIKFTKRYCREAHDLMHRKGCAPKLIHYQERVGGTQYTAIVVEYISGIMHLDEYLEKYPDNKSRPKRFKEAVEVLHDHGFCHGKLTSNNIFMEFKNKKDLINIVNYEWAGRIGEARYPFSADIPDGIEPGDLISKARDRAQLDKFFHGKNK